MANATLHDVARLSGLSIATVSKYLNGIKVKPKNEEKIEIALRESKYSANVFARSLKTKRSMTVGGLLPKLTSSFYNSIISKVEQTLARSGYSLLICTYSNDEKQENERFVSLCSRGVDAILVAPENLNEQSLSVARENQIPVLFFDTSVETPDADTIVTDNYEVCKSTMGEMLSRGFENIAVLLPNSIYSTVENRRRGCFDAMLEQNAEERVTFMPTSGDVASGYESTTRLIKDSAPPDLIFALSSSVFLGALMAVSEAGLKIPKDLAFIGYDNRQISKIYTPNISIIYQPIDEIADAICARLSVLLREENISERRHIVLKSQVIYTDSINH